MIIDQNHQNQLQILHKPVHALKLIAKRQNDIINKLTKSLSLQYDSFQRKYKTLKQLIQDFQIQSQSDQKLILQKDGPKNINFQNQIPKEKQIIEANEEKSSSNTNQRSFSQQTSHYQLRKRSQVQQDERKNYNIRGNKEEQKNQFTKPRAKRHQKDFEQGVQSDQDNEGQDYKKQNIFRRVMGSIKKMEFDKKGPRRYEQTRRQLQQAIRKKQRLYNKHSKIVELLLHPYSTVQMIIEYNESADYPLVLDSNNAGIEEEN